MMKAKLTIAALAAAGILAAVLPAAACEFGFSYERIDAPLGTVGEIGVRVQKDHRNCTLGSMDDYWFDAEGIQILGESPWEEVGPDLYEKWFRVSLSQIGDGYLRISKDCTKEGYEEAVLPITVLEPDEAGVWHDAHDGTYPFQAPASGSVQSFAGDAVGDGSVLTVGSLVIDLAFAPAALIGELGWVRVFYLEPSEGDIRLLLVVSETGFLRFDHLLDDAT